MKRHRASQFAFYPPLVAITFPAGQLFGQGFVFSRQCFFHFYQVDAVSHRINHAVENFILIDRPRQAQFSRHGTGPIVFNKLAGKRREKFFNE